MYGLLETMMRFVGPAIEVGKDLASPVKCKSWDFRCFKNNVQRLKDEAERLHDATELLESLAAHKEDKALVIVPRVRTWLGDANQIQLEMKDIEDGISGVHNGCLHIKARSLLKKKVKETAEAIQDGCELIILSTPPPPTSMALAPLGQVCDFLSRKEIEEDVMKGLREKKVSIMGICGMNGIGKTTLARILMHRATEEDLFDNVLMVVVDHPINMLNIQRQIAKSLDLSLGEGTLQAQAHKLYARLMGNRRTLIIMDDIRDALKLKDVGIPCENGITRCTTLFTSPYTDVLRQMNAKVFKLNILTEEEAWSLFRDKVGSRMDDPNLCSIAIQVAKECKGLPIALVTIGNALKDKKSIAIWKDALHQMKGTDLKNMPNLHKEVRLSYDYLKNQDAKYLFLLCSQFPEYSDIDLNLLTMWCFGLRLFGEISSVKHTRDKIFALVEMLKSRSLLLDGGDKSFVKMYNVVRDAAIMIAVEEGLFDVNNSDCKWMLIFGETYNELPKSSYARLHLLAIHDTFEIEHLPSFERMKELRSLYLKSLSFKSLPQTMKLLENLRTLHLVGCSMECISMVGELLELKILVCSYCDELKELPIEIGRLRRLKLLELKFCSRLKRIASGVISSLIELEELKMWHSFTGWESTKIHEDERSNASLKELELLKKLTHLWIQVADVNLVQEEIHLPLSIVNYRLAFGCHTLAHGDYVKKAITLDLLEYSKCGNWILQLIARTSEVLLHMNGDGCRNCDLLQLHNKLKSLEMYECKTIEALLDKTTPSIDWRMSGGVFPNLKCLRLCQLPNLKEIYVVPVEEESTPFKNLQKLDLQHLPVLTNLWKISNQNVSFNNLSDIFLWQCDKLQNLFFLENGKNVFSQLKSLKIEDCRKMEEVFYSDENVNDERHSCSITFPKLETLELVGLSSLMTFGKGFECIELPCLVELKIAGCSKLTRFVSSITSNLNFHDDLFQLFNDQEVKFGGLKRISIGGYDDVRNILCQQIPLSFFRTLEELHISDCSNITSLFSYAIAQNLVKLRRLNIGKCKRMEQVIVVEEERDEISIEKCDKNIECKNEDEKDGKIGQIAFPNLEELILCELFSLKRFVNGTESIQFSKLHKLSIGVCSGLMTNNVCPVESNQKLGDGATHKHKYDDDQSLHLFCDYKVIFDGLTDLLISDYNGNNIWCQQIPKYIFVTLETLEIYRCHSIRNLFSSSMAKKLVNLKFLHIRRCDYMEEVIAVGNDILENSRLLPSLAQFKLQDLPQLRMFCDVKCALELPLLRNAHIIKCPQMEFLTPGVLHTTKLCGMEVNNQSFWKEELDGTKDLNIFLRQYLMTRKQKAKKNEWGEPIYENASPSYSHAEPPEEITPTETISCNVSSRYSFTSVGTSENITYTSDIGTVSETALDEGEEKRISNEVDVGTGIELEKEEYLTKCLLYCSLFPADYEFSRDTLIWSWIAAGLINSEQSGDMEAAAIRCFDGLITSKYILESGKDHLSDQMKYKLVNDKFCSRNKLPSEHKYRKMLEGDGDLAEVEHLSMIFEQIDQAQLERIRKCTHLKTLLLHKCWGSEFPNLLHDLFLELKVLTTLDLSGTDIEELPSSIETLKALRYLDMSKTPIRELPEWIDSLGHLETLILLQCLSLHGLPKCMNKLVNLQHLVLDLALLLQSMPIGVGKLVNLQTLGAFVVGTRDGHRIGELKNMNKLKGSLCLMKLENILNVDEAGEARLCEKKYISKLEFIWSDLEDAKVQMEEKILENLKPHPGLQELKIVSYSGGVLPSWLNDRSFTQMASITLYECRFCERLSSLGELPSLKVLNIIDMDELVVIDKSFCQQHGSKDQQAFPKLERLSLEGMPNLKKWTGVEDGHFSSLQQLLIKYCPKFVALPALSSLTSLQHLEICYCPVLPCLPEGGLPTSLQCLMLKDCPKLKQRCCNKEGEGKGEDWAKVESVPTLYIDHQRIEPSR